MQYTSTSPWNTKGLTWRWSGRIAHVLIILGIYMPLWWIRVPISKFGSTYPSIVALNQWWGTAHQQASAKPVVEFIEERVWYNDNLKPKDIINKYQMEFGTRISYKKAHMAREMALHKVRGSYGDSFQVLSLYCNELQRPNPGTVTKIDITTDDRFRRFFWAFVTCLQSFRTSQRLMIAVDVSHLHG